MAQPLEKKKENGSRPDDRFHAHSSDLPQELSVGQPLLRYKHAKLVKQDTPPT